jgi:hypothetical protein
MTVHGKADKTRSSPGELGGKDYGFNGRKRLALFTPAQLADKTRVRPVFFDGPPEHPTCPVICGERPGILGGCSERPVSVRARHA